MQNRLFKFFRKRVLEKTYREHYCGGSSFHKNISWRSVSFAFAHAISEMCVHIRHSPPIPGRVLRGVPPPPRSQPRGHWRLPPPLPASASAAPSVPWRGCHGHPNTDPVFFLFLRPRLLWRPEGVFDWSGGYQTLVTAAGLNFVVAPSSASHSSRELTNNSKIYASFSFFSAISFNSILLHTKCLRSSSAMQKLFESFH